MHDGIATTKVIKQPTGSSQRTPVQTKKGQNVISSFKVTVFLECLSRYSKPLTMIAGTITI